jgi:hypothetical protein
MPCPFLGMPCPFLGTLYPFLGMLCAFLGMLCAFLGMLHAFLGMLHAFLGMPCEGEDGIHEESRGLHALHRVLGPSRRRGNECVGSSWERETTRYAYVGMPREHALPCHRVRRAQVEGLAHHRTRRPPVWARHRGQQTSRMVARAGIEPATRGFSVRCSTN